MVLADESWFSSDAAVGDTLPAAGSGDPAGSSVAVSEVSVGCATASALDLSACRSLGTGGGSIRFLTGAWDFFFGITGTVASSKSGRVASTKSDFELYTPDPRWVPACRRGAIDPQITTLRAALLLRWGQRT